MDLRTMRRRTVILAALIMHAVGCARSAASVAPDAGGAPLAPSSAGILSSAVFPAQASQRTAPCLVKELAGDVGMPKAGEPPVLRGGAVPAPGWIDLAPGARLLVDAPPSGQTLLFLGPARVEPCTRGESRAAVLRGRFDSAIGASDAAREEWVVTPVAVVTYRRAALSLDVSSNVVVLDLSSGRASLFPQGGRSFTPLAVGRSWRSSGAPVDLTGATAAVDACEASTVEARSLDIAHDEHPGSVSLAARAGEEHVAARARCAMASLRVAALDGPPEDVAHLALRIDDLGPL